MPESSQAVAMPVPVPSSRKRPVGFEAARTWSNAPVRGSEAMLKLSSAVRASIAAQLPRVR